MSHRKVLCGLLQGVDGGVVLPLGLVDLAHFLEHLARLLKPSGLVVDRDSLLPFVVAHVGGWAGEIHVYWHRSRALERVRGEIGVRDGAVEDAASTAWGPHRGSRGAFTHESTKHRDGICL